MTTRRNRRVQPRPRSYSAPLNTHDSNTSNLRETIAAPRKGKRLRLIRVRAVQERASGGRLYEVYFGVGADINVNPAKAVDTLDIPDSGEAATRTFLKEEGPRGLRNEVLSGRWSGAAPYSVHKIIVEYSEES